MSSYSACMIPRTPIRGLRSVICLSPSAGPGPSTLLAVDVLVPGVHGVDVRLAEQGDVAERPGEVDRPRGVLAHGRGLHRGTRVGPDRENPVAAQQNGGRAGAPPPRRDGLADLVAADAGERRGPDLAPELLSPRGRGAPDG